MKTNDKRSHMIDFIFPLVLFFIFAIAAVTVLILASKIYKNTAANSSLNYTARTSLSYITEKIHQNDNGSVSIETIDDQDCLVISQTYNDTVYNTYIYQYEDSVCELFASADTTITLDAGTEILEVSDLSFSQVNDHLINISCTDSNGNVSQAFVGTRAE